MKKLFIFLFFWIVSLSTAAQKKNAVNSFLYGQANLMAYDWLSGFTGGGVGLGLQLSVHSKNKLKPLLDVSANLFSINKILFIFENGQTGGPKQTVATGFVGFFYEPVKRFEIAICAGPAFHDDGTDFGIKPYAAYYLGKKKIIKAHVSLTHIFVRNNLYNSNTGIASAGLAIKLF